jgi:uncharacterized OsmC-like protein
MKRFTTQLLVIALTIILLFLLNGCDLLLESTVQPAQPTEEAAAGAAETADIATARVSATLSEPGRALITGHNDLQFTVIEEGSGNGLTEIGTLLAAQVTCGVFVAEKAAQELDVPLSGVTGISVFDGDNQRVQVFLDLPGADGEQVLELANNFRQRCPIYTTLTEANSVDFTPGEQFAGNRDDAAVVSAELFRFGGANVTANGTTFVMDSVPPLDGPNEELNPLDTMLGGLAACSVFTYASAAPEAEISATVEGDLNPAGVRVLDGPNPRIQNIRIMLRTDQYDAQTAEDVASEVKEQCHLYNMLEGTVHISLTTEPG